MNTKHNSEQYFYYLLVGSSWYIKGTEKRLRELGFSNKNLSPGQLNTRYGSQFQTYLMERYKNLR